MKKLYQPGEYPKESGLYRLVNTLEAHVEANMKKIIIYIGPYQQLPAVEGNGNVWIKAQCVTGENEHVDYK